MPTEKQLSDYKNLFFISRRYFLTKLPDGTYVIEAQNKDPVIFCSREELVEKIDLIIAKDLKTWQEHHQETLRLQARNNPYDL